MIALFQCRYCTGIRNLTTFLLQRARIILVVENAVKQRLAAILFVKVHASKIVVVHQLYRKQFECVHEMGTCSLSTRGIACGIHSDAYRVIGILCICEIEMG